MNPTLILLALVAAGYFLLKDEDKESDGASPPAGRRHGRGYTPPQSYVTAPGLTPGPTPAPRLPAPAPAPRAAAPASSALVAAAQALVATLPSPDCTAISAATLRFQQQALAEGRSVGGGADGQYGPSTQRLLSDVLRRSAPAALWGPGGRCRGTRPVAATGPSPVPHSADSGPGSARPLLDQLNAMIASGDGKADPDEATNAYKAAGMFAVTTLGPAIDVQTNGQSKPLTQEAWQANGPLQAVNSTYSYAHFWTMGHKATIADKMRARDILTTQMRDKYAAALDRFGGADGSGYDAGGCFDAVRDLRLCAAVASALASEQSPMALRSFGATLASMGFPQAANALLAKADSLPLR